MRLNATALHGAVTDPFFVISARRSKALWRKEQSVRESMDDEAALNLNPVATLLADDDGLFGSRDAHCAALRSASPACSIPEDGNQCGNASDGRAGRVLGACRATLRGRATLDSSSAFACAPASRSLRMLSTCEEAAGSLATTVGTRGCCACGPISTCRAACPD